MMKQQIPTPLAILIVVVVLAIIGFLGWRFLNPPEPKPVGMPPGQQMMPPAIPPVAPGQQGQPAGQPPGTPAQPQTGGQPSQPM
jgi:hypothetical protein